MTGRNLHKISRKAIFFAFICAAIMLNSCGSQRLKDFDFIKNQQAESFDSTEKKIYLTGTLPIDSADVNKLIYDIFRIEIDEYPNRIKIFSRVFDSTGHFITNMADPYKQNPDINYFTSMKETLGRHYNLRDTVIPKFEVREYGAKDSIPYNIVLNVDYSGSMDPVIGAVYQGTEMFVSMKMDYDNIGIATFNKDLDVKIPLSKEKDRILSLYNIKKTQGFGLFTAVYDALYNSINIFEGSSDSVPRVLVIFTDGDDNYSKKEIGALIQKAKDMKIKIFTVAFGYSKDDNLRQIASYTGGKFYKFYTKEELIAIFRDIYMSLRYYYFITYTPPKYWGWHTAYSTLTLPGRDSVLIAQGEYDTSDLWKDIGSEFVRPILFDFDKSDLKPESGPIIDEIVDAMMSRPKLRLEIQGHTDNMGTIEYNQKLSENRARAVYDAIIRKGIDPARLRYRGFGMSMPKASNDTEAGRIENRRTQFIVLAK